MDMKTHVIEAVTEAAHRARIEVLMEEQRLAILGRLYLTAPSGHFIRCVRAGWAAFITAWRL